VVAAVESTVLAVGFVDGICGKQKTGADAPDARKPAAHVVVHAVAVQVPLRFGSQTKLQATHEADPVTVLMVPAAQAVQGPPLGPEKPALQMQPVCTCVLAGAELPAGHAVQVPPLAPQKLATQLHPADVVVPAGETLLLGHAVQGPPGGPKKLALQTHALAVVDPCGLELLAGHAVHGPPGGPQKLAAQMHAAELVAPVAVVRLFEGQAVHDGDPALGANVLSGHAVQAPPGTLV
jgi:hypothetical protein